MVFGKKEDSNNIDTIDVDEETRKKLVKEAKELYGITNLSERESEIAVLYTSEHSDVEYLNEVAEKLNISEEAVYSTWNSVKEKYRKAKSTVEHLDGKI